MLSFGVRGMFGSVPIVNAYRLDQAIVGLFLAPVSLGFYVVAVSFTNLPRFIAVSIGALAYPNIARERSLTEARRRIWRYQLLALAICGAVVVPCIALASTIVPAVFGREFSETAHVAQVLLIGGLVIAGQRVLIDGARGLARPGVGSASELAMLITLIAAGAVLIPLADLTGVAWAMVAASFVGYLVALRGVLAQGSEDRWAGAQALPPLPGGQA